ncbi:MAG: CHAT domain-containing protein [Vicinamibacterales bacterium]
MAAAQQEIANWTLKRARILRKTHPTPDELQFVRDQPGYRLFLQVDLEPLAAVPWELARVGGPLFLQDDTPISRFVVVPGRRDVSDPEWQVRVLVVVAADNPEAIGADEEVRAIKRALRPMDRVYDVDVIRHPSRQKLTERLAQFMPHILHFIGHGTGTDLQIYDAEDRKTNVAWGADEIRIDLGPRSWIPDVVYLNACRSQGTANWEDASPADQARQRTIVDALFARGVLAVVAMQADVQGQRRGALRLRVLRRRARRGADRRRLRARPCAHRARHRRRPGRARAVFAGAHRGGAAGSHPSTRSGSRHRCSPVRARAAGDVRRPLRGAAHARARRRRSGVT